MRRTTTVVCTVGVQDDIVEAAAQAGGNVAYEPAPPLPEDAVERMRVAASGLTAARRRNAIYTLITVDPLEPVVREWAARLRGEDHDLETVTGLATREPLPDYYLVGADLEGDCVHWYLDLVYRRSNHRVLPIEPTTASLLHTLGHLPRGPELPSGQELAAYAGDYVPPHAVTATHHPERRSGARKRPFGPGGGPVDPGPSTRRRLGR